MSLRRRQTYAEHIQHLNKAEEYLTSGFSTYEAAEKLMADFGCGEKTAYRWCERVRKRWAEESQRMRPQLREQAIARLMKLRRDFEKRGSDGPLMQCERLLTEICGLKAPEQHQVQLQAAVAVQSVSSLPDAFRALEALPMELLEALESALTAKALPAAIQDAEIVEPVKP